MRLSFFKILVLCLMIPCLVFIPACSDDDDDPTTPTANIHENLVTIWRAQSVSIDGTDVPLGDFFEFTEGAVAFNLIITEDGGYRGEEVDSVNGPANVLYYEEGTAVSSGQTLTLTLTSENGVDLPSPEVVAVGTWVVDESHLIFTMEEEGQTIVINWTNWMI